MQRKIRNDVLQPGIRGSLVLVLAFFIIRPIAMTGLLFIILFGSFSEPGMISIYRQGLFEQLTSQQQAYLILVPMVQLALIAFSLVVLWALVRKKKITSQLFFLSVVIGFAVSVIDGLAAFSLFGEEFRLEGTFTGLLVAVAIKQHLSTSKQAEITLVN